MCGKVVSCADFREILTPFSLMKLFETVTLPSKRNNFTKRRQNNKNGRFTF